MYNPSNPPTVAPPSVLCSCSCRTVPFGFGVVELPEGLRLITRLTETDPARLAFDMPMRLTIVPLHVDADGREIVTYAFAPER